MTKIICVECGNEMTEQYLGQDWCETCHTKFHLECKEENKPEIWCIDCCGREDCGLEI